MIVQTLKRIERKLEDNAKAEEESARKFKTILARIENVETRLSRVEKETGVAS